MIDIFNYTDYRAFLNDFYIQSKERNSHFSYQLFSQKAGINSKGFLFNVIKGKKHLSKANILGLMRACNLAKQGAEYFECLVDFNQARTLTEKNHAGREGFLSAHDRSPGHVYRHDGRHPERAFGIPVCLCAGRHFFMAGLSRHKPCVARAGHV
jgi:uncharacterized protein (TIGR02147 family)